MKLLKTLRAQLFGAVNDTVDKHASPIRTLRQAVRDLETEKGKVEGHLTQASLDLAQFSEQMTSVRNEINDVRQNARESKARGDKDRALRLLKRVSRMEERLSRREDIEGRLLDRLDRTRKVYTELNDRKEELQFELTELEADHELSKLRINQAGGRASGAGSNLRDLDDLISDARKKVNETVMLADATEQTRDFVDEVEGVNESDPASDGDAEVDAKLQKLYDQL